MSDRIDQVSETGQEDEELVLFLVSVPCQVR